jgi:cyanophycinase-like exopeptidase
MRLTFAFLLFVQALHGQLYTSYFTGDPTDVVTNTAGGLVLMGGATEDDAAMKWFLQQSNGGDVVVIRASGADGYNDYFYSELGIAVNSVETIVTTSLAAANDPYVAQQIRRAEALWIAGGDQSKYVQFWKNGLVGDAIQYLIREKKVVVGGTSAGMAILGEAYFSATNGSVTSAEALANPYNNKVTIGYADFVKHPDLQHVITDTHYDDPDRRGRHTTFLARLVQDHGIRALGIACEEYTAVCVDSAGLATVYGGYPQYEDYAYFLQANCEGDFTPENCVPGAPLHWVREEEALRVFKAEGRSDSARVTFDLRDWRTTAGGGIWENWWVSAGVFATAPAPGAPLCVSAAFELQRPFWASISPNPAGEFAQLQLSPEALPARAEVFDLNGKILFGQNIATSRTDFSLAHFPPGMYFVRVKNALGSQSLPLIRNR